MIYEDGTPMPFGTHINKPLAQVPADYLIYIRDNFQNLHEGFKTYIDNKRPELELTAAADKQRTKAQRKYNLK